MSTLSIWLQEYMRIIKHQLALTLVKGCYILMYLENHVVKTRPMTITNLKIKKKKMLS